MNQQILIIIIILIICSCLISIFIVSRFYIINYTNTQYISPIPTPTNMPPTNTSQPSPPLLLNNQIHYQGKCEGDACSGLIWTGGGGTRPWNKYYKFSCVNDNNVESKSTPVFGPVSHFNWQKPKIRLQQNGIYPCGDNNVKVYRGNNPAYLSPLYMTNFNLSGKYNGKDVIFVDTN